MIGRVARDESGIAMGIAVVLIVIVGVMGAGLLVFVRNDLEAVVQVNQGQEAFETAEAGVQAAKRELLSDACPQSYDGVEAGTPEDDDSCSDSEESEWSYAAVEEENVETQEEEEDYVGRELSFGSGEDNDNITVKIRHLPFHEDDDSCDDGSLSAEDDPQEHLNCAPDTKNGAEDARRFFEVVSTGESDSRDAKRRVEAIYSTYDLGVPKAYYTPNDVTITGNAIIDNVSVFSGGNVDINNGAEITGEDRAYRRWAAPSYPNEYNDEPRLNGNAGIGALGSIKNKVNGRDFDGGTTPPFESDPESGDMTFPFNEESQSGQADQDRIDFLREEAKNNGVYYTSTGGKVGIGSDFNWPADADESTVVFVEYTGVNGNNQADWEVGSKSDPPAEGTLVVNGGDFNLAQNKACLKGVAIVRGGEYEEGDSKDTGNGKTCINGFVNASGTIKLAGNVEPLASEEVLDRPGFYGVEQWSWRELYE